ncbi:nucleoporin complex subunit 54-domain-containing protein [Hysterangium stoloniferum]|nr:nucleoporin complex subunit 54-domain-containing protein [Hysterangium stoloniferum]
MKHYFYNLVDPRQVHLYGRPANVTNDALWQQAVRENPDPSTMVPVLAVGFDDLQKRVEAQSSQATQHNEKLKELQTRLAALSQTHILSNTLRTTQAMQTHMIITHRLLRLVEHLHLLIPSLRSAAISPEEEALRARLERLRDELVSGASRGRLNELWALMGAVRAAKEREIGAGGDGVEWKVVDWEGLEKLAGILSEQQQGLAHLTSIINNGLKDLQIMEGSAPRNSGPSLSASTLGNQ